MPLDFIIKKEGYNALAAELKALYKEQEDGSYQLSVNGLPQPEDVSGLKAQLDRVLSEKKSESEKRAQADKEAREAAEKAARAAGDIEALDKSYQERIQTLQAELEGKLNNANSQIQKLMVDNVVNDLATKLSKSNANLIKPFLKERLALEQGTDGSYLTRVLKDGKPSALTIDDLHKEFVSNKEFAPIIDAPDSSGTGGFPQKPDAGKTSTPPVGSRGDLAARGAQIAANIS